ncbi:hypothetical protein ACFO25_17985 [Paenactinomyces guangxiensis]|uniref:Uncharacterized protein n=1 Tax=Paenactinomyces guangxiensis TaxID=1490290 RepID=A0A7W2A8H5_9BACL|nr:hypothetical protein [Paenactinomyces guangxiensis]MBA4494645.1 hypothetical protein [Paenactinomyces guangxiensis]MBH8591729.1 hypothetical protein [Paenactinomyces guangxiensis]
MNKDNRRGRDRKRRRRGKIDLEAISTPRAQATQDQSNNAAINLIDNPKDTDIKIFERVSESGRGSQKVIND